ncbi:MAG: ATP-binding protein [Bacteroidales bacterium]|nr:ATP-binding protein [Bacteroidales bacterium]MCF8336937.1 ATP-binding protein [Bacteroidales bacterium]
MKNIKVKNLGQIKEADITLGDFTVFVGPQASGKSILLQVMKLALDGFDIKTTIKKQGFDWNGSVQEFMRLYLGEGMGNVLTENTTISLDNKQFHVEKMLRSKRGKNERLFLIPAQRVMSISNGWPNNFMGFAYSDPYVLKHFSENLRLLMEAGLGTGNGGSIFPKAYRMKKQFRDKLNESIFFDATVELDKKTPKRRIMLSVGNEMLPYMVWSAGQREFMPLLLGLYWLMPSQKLPKRDGIDYVVIEEPEMGLHPMAIQSLLLTFLDLNHRGYKVIVSTHSPVILEFIWAIQIMQEMKVNENYLFDMFNIEHKVKGIKDIFNDILKNKDFKTYFFSRKKDGIYTRNISSLEPGTEDEDIAEWGGLTSFSSRVSEIISNIMATENDI